MPARIRFRFRRFRARSFCCQPSAASCTAAASRCLLLPLSYLLPSSADALYFGPAGDVCLLPSPVHLLRRGRSPLCSISSSPVTVIVKRTFAIRLRCPLMNATLQKTPVFYHNTPPAFSQRERNRKAAPYLMTLPSSLILFSLMAFRTCSFSFTAAGLSAPLPDPSSEYIFPASPSPRRSWTAALC